MVSGITLAIALTISLTPVSSTGALTQVTGGVSRLRTLEQVSTERFSIRYPSHWMITARNHDFLTIFNQPPLTGGGDAPPYMIKTDVGIQPLSLEAVLRDREAGENLSTEFGGELVSRQIEEVVVNGRNAVQIWQTGGDTFSHSVATYIPVSDRETAYLVSFYNRQNRAAETAILQVHNSFELVRSH